MNPPAMLQQSINEVEYALKCHAQLLRMEGWSWYVDNQAPTTFEELKNLDKKMIPITIGNNTVWSESGNLRLRFIHDVLHIALDKSFSLIDEEYVVETQCTIWRGAGVSEDAIRLLYIDMYGQRVYYEKHKEYVKDQQKFMWKCLLYGIDAATGVKV